MYESKLLVMNFKDILSKKPIAKYCMICAKRAGLIKEAPQSLKPIYIRKNNTRKITVSIDYNSKIYDLLKEYYKTTDEEEKQKFLQEASNLLYYRLEKRIYG